MSKAGTVTVFGGSGFIGRHLVQQLARAGYQVRVAVRRPDLAGFLQPLGGVSQITAVKADLRDEPSIKEAIKGADYVVNLVGILAEGGGQNFNNIHVHGARLVAIAAREANVKQLVHVSALGADPASKSKYARSKAHGEDAVLNMEPTAIILRPSVVFGPEDEFFNRFASIMSVSPVVPLFAGKTKFQPIYVGDLAAAIVAALDGKGEEGAIYELGGPQIISMRAIHEDIKRITGRNTALLPLPLIFARGIAIFTAILPNPPVTSDQIKLLKKDNIVSPEAIEEHRTLKDLSPLNPRSVAAIVPNYLDRFETHRHAFNNANRS